eukprot:263656-Chlamydomonas_euryale.AAC.2
MKPRPPFTRASSLLLDLLAASGYTSVATPYAVTFKHDECAAQVRGSFLAAVDELRASDGTVRVKGCWGDNHMLWDAVVGWAVGYGNVLRCTMKDCGIR